MNLKTTHALLITLGVLVGGFVWATFFPQSPFVSFSGTVGLVFGAYAGKRLLQKKEEFIEQDS